MPSIIRYIQKTSLDKLITPGFLLRLISAKLIEVYSIQFYKKQNAILKLWDSINLIRLIITAFLFINFLEQISLTSNIIILTIIFLSRISHLKYQSQSIFSSTIILCIIEMEKEEVNLDYPEVSFIESIQDKELFSTDEKTFKKEEKDRKFLELRHYHTQ